VLAGQPPLIFGDGEQTRDYSFVTDIADGIVRVAMTPAARGGVINLASGEEITINRLVRTLAAILGYEGPLTYAAPRPGDVRRHLADISRARELIGYRPQTDLETGLGRTVAWYLGAR
jgi:UDP-glucose 4-epimerase